VLAACCLAVALVAGARAHAELTRPPTAAERSAAATADVAGRWRAWPAGRIFPARLRYTTVLQTSEAARRLGISAGTACMAAVTGPANLAALRDGCRAALRATYADQLQGVVYTVGVFAFTGPASAAAFLRGLAAGPRGRRRFHDPGDSSVMVPEKSTPYGLRAQSVPGTAAALFTDAARQVMAGLQRGPYVVLAVAGYADGRPAIAAGRRRFGIFQPAGQLAAEVLTPLSALPHVTCTRPEWLC
jgi:hypothetical protein